MSPARTHRHRRYPTFRRSLRFLRESDGEGKPVETHLVKDHLLRFVEKLQRRYPFSFAIAYRNLKSELNKQVQERLTTQFLFGAISELAELEPDLRDRVWRLAALLSQQVSKGGENFRPRQFNLEEQTLAQEIGEEKFETLIRKAEELSMAMKFKIGPVNSAEHVISWSFRYVGQLLKAAKWESTHARGQPDKPGPVAGASTTSEAAASKPSECEPKSRGSVKSSGE